MFKNKKAVITETLIFIILTVVFVAILLIFVSRLGSGATFYEQAYAKQIALTFDTMKPGTNVSLFLPDLFKFANKNKVSYQEMIKLNFEKNSVVVRLSNGKGYEYVSYTPLKSGSIAIDLTKNMVILSV